MQNVEYIALKYIDSMFLKYFVTRTMIAEPFASEITDQ